MNGLVHRKQVAQVQEALMSTASVTGKPIQEKQGDWPTTTEGGEVGGWGHDSERQHGGRRVLSSQPVGSWVSYVPSDYFT